MKIRHQLIYKGRKEDKILAEIFMEWKLTPEELETPIKQFGIMNWEEDQLIKQHIKIKRQVFDDDKEWEEEMTKSNERFK